MPCDTSQPAHEMPHWPTRPLLFGTFFTSQSIVSQVSVLSFGFERSLDDRHVMNELALRLELPARVLVDEDVALFGELVVRAERRRGSSSGPCGAMPYAVRVISIG